MKNKIYVLTDYKDHFGSKWNATPYRSGFDLKYLEMYFDQNDIKLEFLSISESQNLKDIEGNIFLYTSSEDQGYYYKSFIEDIILYLEMNGGIVLPSFKYLRANNNKAFMELIRRGFEFEGIRSLSSFAFGTLEELKRLKLLLSYPIVLKKSSGAMSTGVFLAKNEKELFKKVKKLSKAGLYRSRIKDYLRKYKHRGYVPDSPHRSKFVVQEFIPGLDSDYKVLIFGKRYFIFERPTRKNDFRASGSGNQNYIYGSKVECPSGMLDFAQEVYESMDVPQLSIDIAFDGKQFYLIEYQALYFGTVGVVKSDGFYIIHENEWIFQSKKIDLEKIYVDSVLQYINNKRY